MPLIDLQTDLKSLKYGQDQPGGGNSGQPYIQVDINRVDTGFNRFRMTKFDDGLIRGGAVGAANASIVDTLRIGKFLTDFPKGPLFIVKQVGLQLSQPQLEFKKLRTDNPTSGGGLLRNVGNFIANTANKIVNAVGPTRIYNLGINTLAQVPVNAFGQHIVRHGLLPIQNDDTKYINVAEYNNYGDGKNNRLVGYRSKFQLGDNKPNPTQSRNVINTVNRISQALGALTGASFNPIKLEPEQLTINKYISGPGSIYGIGNTLIRRYSFTEDGVKINFAKNRNYVKQHLPEVKLYQTFDYGVSNLSTSTLSANSFDLKQQPEVLSASFQENTINNTDAFIKSQNNAGLALVNNERQAFTYIDPNTSNGAVSSGLGQRNNLSDWNKDKHIRGNAYLKADFNKFKDIPTDANEIAKAIGQISSINDPINNLEKKPRVNQVTASADLGLSKLGSEIPGFLPSEINTINTAINQNAVPYSTPLNKTYTELRDRINKTSTISQNYFKTDDTFTINRGATDLKYVANQLKDKFKRTNDIVVTDDTMALKFTPLDPFSGDALNVLSFLGYLNEYSEDYNSTWGNTRYVGRAESFYIFNEFKRTASIGFQIPCYNREELIAKHCLLSELASTLAGKYENNLLGGIITKLKIGNYINNQPGIITNLNFSPIQDSNWDLDIQLAYYIKVSFGFTFIHDYLPQYYECGFIFKDPTPEPELVPVQPSPQPDPTPQPAPQTPLFSNDTGSLNAVGIVGRTDFREKIDSTFVKKPIIPVSIVPKFKGFGGGSFGGGGAGRRF